MLTVPNSEQFADKAPAQICADLLDEEKYFCSVRTMYRILAGAGEVRRALNLEDPKKIDTNAAVARLMQMSPACVVERARTSFAVARSALRSTIFCSSSGSFAVRNPMILC